MKQDIEMKKYQEELKRRVSGCKYVQLEESMRSSFLDYSQTRTVKPGLTNEKLNEGFDFYVKHKARCYENGAVFYSLGGRTKELSFGYSGQIKNDEQGMTNDLYHRLWCEIEWTVRNEQ